MSSLEADATVLVSLDEVEAVLRRSPAPSLDWLSPSERLRLDGISAVRRRRQFLAGRWLARCQLGHCAGGDAFDWTLDAEANAPPQVCRTPQGVIPQVSLSHSGDWVACAVALQGPLGVDVECPRSGRDLDGLASLVLHPDEMAAWRGMAAQDREGWFYRLWTLKEAWIKSRAEALSPRRAARLRSRPATPGDSLVVHSVEVPGRLACAVVAPAGAHIDWSPRGSALLSVLASATQTLAIEEHFDAVSSCPPL